MKLTLEQSPIREYEEGFDLPGSPGGDPYVGWSDDQRMEEFAHTGDGRYLTPSLARAMGVSEEVMREVPRVTPDDISYAVQRDLSEQNISEQERLAVLQEYGVDGVSLRAMEMPQIVDTLMDAASKSQGESFDYDLEDVQNYAKSHLLDGMLQNPEVTLYCFQAIGGDTSMGGTLRRLKVVEDLCEQIRFLLLADSDEDTQEKQQAFLAYQKIREAISVIRESEARPDSSALVTVRLQSFAAGYEKKYQEGWVDMEDLAPALVAPGQFLVWDWEKSTPYLCRQGDDAYVDRIFDEYEVDTKAGKLLRRDVGDMKPFEIDSVDQPEDAYNLHESMVNILEHDYRLSDYLREHISGYSEEDFDDFSEMMRETSRGAMKEYIGFDQSELTLQEQWHLFQYLKRVKVKELDEVRSFATNYGKDGMRSFLSREQGGSEMEGVILSIGKKFSEDNVEIGRKIFEKYGEIVEASYSVADYLQEQLGYEDAAVAEKIQEDLLLRAQVFLKMVAGTQEAFSQEKILEMLGKLSGDVEIFRLSIRNLKSAELLENLDFLKDAQFVSLTGESIQEKHIAAMRQIYEANYQGESAEFREMLLVSFDAKVKDPSVQFKIYFHKDRVVSFAAFRTLSDQSMHFGAFNTDESYGGAKIGGTFLETALEEIPDDVVVLAECDVQSAVTGNYLNKQDFFARDYFVYRDKPSFNIQRNQDHSYETYDQSHVFDHAETVESLQGDQFNSPLFLEYGIGDHDEIKSKLFDRNYVQTQRYERNGLFYGVFQEIDIDIETFVESAFDIDQAPDDLPQSFVVSYDEGGFSEVEKRFLSRGYVYAQHVYHDGRYFVLLEESASFVV